MRIKIPSGLRKKWEQLPLKRRQYLFLATASIGGFLLVWLVLSVGSEPKKPPKQTVVDVGKNAAVTNVTTPGRVNALDEWVGNAGRKLAQYDKEKAAQEKINADRATFEKTVMERLDHLSKQPAAPAEPPAAASTPAPQPAPERVPAKPSKMTSPADGPGQMPPGMPPGMGTNELSTPVAPQPAVPVLGRVSLGAAKPAGAAPAPRGASAPSGGAATAERAQSDATKGDTCTFLPVSFTRGVLLGGIDAPTGGQAQSNPQPVLIRLADNAVLPNRYRAQVRECFVVAAGYGDISSERALFRTISLSCVRHDGTVIEVDIKGSVYGEDGKLGMRGRLVTKQGQILANALRAGIVGGIGDGFSRSGTTVTTGAYGSVSTQSGDLDQNMQRGLMRGVGRAMDQLADYYVHLAEKTFPIIEIDAGRQVDVVITKGTYLPTQAAGSRDDDDGDVRAGARP